MADDFPERAVRRLAFRYFEQRPCCDLGIEFRNFWTRADACLSFTCNSTERSGHKFVVVRETPGDNREKTHSRIHVRFCIHGDFHLAY